MPQRPHRLVTLVFSHYNEKARWALDHCGIAYEEQRLMPGFSQIGAMVATRGRGGRKDDVSSRFSTPVLVTSDGERLCDSTDIALWASARAGDKLFPEPAVLDLVTELGRDLGPYTRRAAYWFAFNSKTAFRTLTKNVGPGQALAYRALAPLGSALIRKGLGVTRERTDRALERVRAVVAKMDARLEKSRYLVGDRFTAADLTFAALMAPALLVSSEEGYGAIFPGADELGPDARALVAEMRGTRAGRFALQMFRDHRRT